MTKKQRVIAANPILDCVDKMINCRQHLHALLNKNIINKEYQPIIKLLSNTEDKLMNDAESIIKG